MEMYGSFEDRLHHPISRVASNCGFGGPDMRRLFVAATDQLLAIDSDMTLKQLRVFVAVVEIEHVTRASYALDMMQSAVSKSVAALEGETGLRLFDRVGRNIRLTATGAAFRDRACELLDHACRLEAWAAASRPAHPKATLVRVCVGRPTRGIDPSLA